MEKNFFDQPVKSDMDAYEIICKIKAGQGDDYTTGCLLEYNYFKKYYKMIAISLSKQQALDDDPKAIQQINFTGNLKQVMVEQYFPLWKKQKKPFSILRKEQLKYYDCISF